VKLAAPVESPPTIGVAPLLDIVFLLLVFFMVTTSFRTAELPLELADAESAAASTDLQEVLASHGPDDRGTDHTLCRHGDYYETTAAVVLLPAERSLQVVFGRPCEQRFVTHTVDGALPEAAPGERRPRPLPIV